MNRTDRLYAIVEELRAASPATTTAATLAARFEVSVRTIERDVLALQEAGVPIWTNVGRRGGIGIDPATTLPPLNLTGAEAIAVVIALAQMARSPFARSSRTALQKVRSVLPDAPVAVARDLAGRVRTAPAEVGGGVAFGVSAAVESSLVEHRALDIDYVDASGAASHRCVEPVGVLCNGGVWYLVAWCRTRNAERGFRLDRIRAAVLTDERVAPRSFVLADEWLHEHTSTVPI